MNLPFWLRKKKGASTKSGKMAKKQPAITKNILLASGSALKARNNPSVSPIRQSIKIKKVVL